jgi:hypothetical protein
MLRKIICPLLMLIVSCFFSCSDSAELKKNLLKLNIDDATSLVVYNSSDEGGRKAASEANLYKLTLSGSVEQVKFITEDNKEVDPNSTTIQVTSIHPVDENLLIITGSFLTEDAQGLQRAYSALLVRKSDGAIFDFGNVNIDQSPATYGEETFRTDNAGSFYYLDFNELGVMKVNTTDPEHLSRSSLLANGQKAYYYSVDKDGNCVYQPDPFYSWTRLRKNNGAIYEFDANDGVMTFWVSQRGQLYCNSYDFTDEVPEIKTINVNTNGEVITNVVWKAAGFGANPGVQNLNFQYYYMIRKSNSVIFIALQNGKSFEFFEDEASVVEFDLPDIGGGKLVHSGDYCYVAKDTKLYKISLTDYSYENLFADGQYEVYSMTVNTDNVLLLSAMRFSDGKKIIAEINGQNIFSVLEEKKDQDALYLQRIN